MSIVTYNGVTLPYAETTRFTQKALRDPSDTDWYLTEFDISVTCLINSNYLGLLSPSLIGNTRNPADIMNVIRTQLLLHRRALSFTFNGVQLIPQPQGSNPGTVDAQNGPKPQSCVIIGLTDTTFLLQYHIIAHYWESSNTNTGSVAPTGSPIVVNLAGNDVLYNRWSETMEFDDCQYTTRTRAGKFIIRSDNTDGFTAGELLRQMAVVGIPKGFLRASSTYRVDPDGLGLEYRVVDKEVYQMPPSPAFTSEGHYYEMTTQMGASRICEATVKLRGSKTTSQSLLIQAAVDTASAKIDDRINQLTALFNDPKAVAILQQAALRQSLYDNEIEFSMRYLFAADNTIVGNSNNVINPVNAFYGVGTITPNSDPNYTPPYTSRATASRMLQAANYYDPSLTSVIMGQNAGALNQGGLFPGQAGKTKEP